MTLNISAKCSDLFNAQLSDGGKTIGEYHGYVPSWFPNAYGDYVELGIDTATGQILNWVAPTEEQLNKTFELKEE